MRDCLLFYLYYYYYYYVLLICVKGEKGLGSDIDAVTIFTQYEKMALERIVASDRCDQMLSSNKSTFVFK